MTITPSQIYWITRLDNISGFFTVLSVIGVMLCLFATCVAMLNWDYDEFPKRILWVYVPTILFAILVILTPTTKEMAAIYIIPAIANNKKVQQMPDKLMTLADEWIEELRLKNK